MASNGSFMRQYYDRIIAAGVLLIVIGSLLYIFFIGLPVAKEAANEALAESHITGAKIAKTDLSAYDDHLEKLASPTEDALVQVRPDRAPNLFTPEHRVICIKCGAPIPFSAEVCPYANCRAEQPKAKVIDLSTRDSDGDGLYDVWELKYGLNPEDPSDADIDTDNDGFTNKEEFDAGTDPTDPKSHPSYVDRISVQEVAGNRANLRLTNMMRLPDTKLEDGTVVPHVMGTFRLVNENGEMVGREFRARDGEEIIGESGKSTGYTFVSFKDDRPTITVGKNKQKRLINASTALLRRASDGKTFTITFYDKGNPNWPGDPLLEQTATLAVDGVPGVETIAVVPEATFKVNDEAYTVLSINPEAKTVEVKRMADAKRFSLK